MLVPSEFVFLFQFCKLSEWNKFTGRTCWLPRSRKLKHKTPKDRENKLFLMPSAIATATSSSSSFDSWNLGWWVHMNLWRAQKFQLNIRSNEGLAISQNVTAIFPQIHFVYWIVINDNKRSNIIQKYSCSLYYQNILEFPLIIPQKCSSSGFLQN